MELTWSSHQLRDSIYTCSLAQEAWKSFGRMERKAHNPWESGAKLLSLWGTPWNQWWRFLHDTSLWYLCASYSACVLDQAPSSSQELQVTCWMSAVMSSKSVWLFSVVREEKWNVGDQAVSLLEQLVPPPVCSQTAYDAITCLWRSPIAHTLLQTEYLMWARVFKLPPNWFWAWIMSCVSWM